MAPDGVRQIRDPLFAGGACSEADNFDGYDIVYRQPSEDEVRLQARLAHKRFCQAISGQHEPPPKLVGIPRERPPAKARSGLR